MKDFYYQQIQLFIERLNQYIESTNYEEVKSYEDIKKLIIESVKDLMNNKTEDLKNKFKKINDLLRILDL